MKQFTKHIILSMMIIVLSCSATAQVGIGTTTPHASAKLEISSTTQGVLIPRMTDSQRAAIQNPVAGLIVYQTNANPGNYVFNGITWDILSSANYGDVKTGIQTVDHNGWIRLDGRLKSNLSASQQSNATALGIGTNLPNAAHAFLVQNGTTLGTVTGNNTKTIIQSNLPNVALGGSTTTNGSHTHTTKVNDNNVAQSNVATAMKEANTNWTQGVATSNPTVMESSGDHSHSITTTSINGGVTQTALDITPRSLSVNTFIYLGL